MREFSNDGVWEQENIDLIVENNLEEERSTIFHSFSASILIFVTTADDAIWLLPFVISQKRFSIKARMLHAAVFVLSLQIVVGLCSVGTAVFGNMAGAQAAGAFGLPLELTLKVFATVLAWAIVAYLYIRKLLKHRRRELQKLGSVANQGFADSTVMQTPPTAPPTASDNSDLEIETGRDSNIEREPASPITVLMLGFAGALDEMTYFPSLLLSDRFKTAELATGAFLATTMILIVMVFFMAHCHPILDVLDRIPLYVIVGVFAIMMSFETISEYNELE